MEEHSFEDSKFVHKERGFFFLFFFFFFFFNDKIFTKIVLMFDDHQCCKKTFPDLLESNIAYQVGEQD
jgi:hypothetical protein